MAQALPQQLQQQQQQQQQNAQLPFATAATPSNPQQTYPNHLPPNFSTAEAQSLIQVYDTPW